MCLPLWTHSQGWVHLTPHLTDYAKMCYGIIIWCLALQIGLECIFQVVTSFKSALLGKLVNCMLVQRQAQSVVIVPGYGLAVAAAQYDIAELVKTLRGKGVDVKCGPDHSHPVSMIDLLNRSARPLPAQLPCPLIWLYLGAEWGAGIVYEPLPARKILWHGCCTRLQ